MKKIALFSALPLLLIVLIRDPCLSVVTRGINVTTASGTSLSLYNDYYASVVGVSDYEKWPDLPNAVKEAQEVSESLSAFAERIGFDIFHAYGSLHKALRTITNQWAITGDDVP